MSKLYLGDIEIFNTYLGNIETVNEFSTDLNIEYLIVGAGGEGFSGGGGGAQYVTGSATLLPGTYNVTAAKITTGAGTGQVSGSSSTFLGISSKGGGSGGNFFVSAGQGWNGACGGGAGRNNGAIGGIGSAGFNGGNSDGANRGGGGGGAAAAGANGGLGGNGKQWLDGTYYCGGGAAENGPGGGLGAAPNAGGGGNFGSGPSGPGLVKIRYIGSPRASGGTIAQSGGYTYHSFIGSSTDTTGSFTY